MSLTDKNQNFRTRLRVQILALVVIAAMAAAVVLPAPADALEPSELHGAAVYLVNVETGQFVDGDGDGVVDQSRVPNLDDQWVLDEVRPGIFSFTNVQRGRLLDADGQDKDYDVNLSDNLESDTEWQVVPRGGGIYEIISVEYGMWLDADGEDKDFNVDLTPQGDEPDAHWYIALANVGAEDLDGATVLLANAATGLFLDGDAHTVDQSVAPRVDDQWIVEAVGDDVTFRSAAQDRLLLGTESDVLVGGNGDYPNKWRLRQRSNGAYEIRNQNFGLWLDADYADKNFNVDLTPNVGDVDANWHILVIDTDQGCVTEGFDEIDDLLLCVDATDAFTHLRALQAIADANGGTRQSGTPGYDASADYVAGLLQAAGFTVQRQVFDFSVYTVNSASVSADGADIAFLTASFAASGVVVDGIITAVDLDLGPDNASTSGCEPEDFAGLDLSGPNDVALIQRGACNFSVKALNAQDAGAEAVILFNQGNTPDRTDILGATLGAEIVGTIAIPVVGISYDDGVALTTAGAVSVALDSSTVTSTTSNIIADMVGANPNNVVMAGAHLDSVQGGPGIQDNGTGSATLLTIALTLADNESYVPQNSLRFAWWGAEEAGLIGSTEYIFNPVFGISDADYAALAAYLNFDMVGSPNYFYGVYDADQSTFAATANVPEGSAALEDLFEAYYTLQGVPYEDTAFSGRSDYQAFINVGIPSSGLFTGAEGIKTDVQASIWGGTAGEQFDPCYHLACDTIDNPSFEALEENIDAIAYAILNMAASTQSVNGVPGIDPGGTTPDEVVFDGPQGTFATGIEDGGAIQHDDYGVAE